MTAKHPGLTLENKRTRPIFYVYVYWIDGSPFYIGKGHANRYLDHFHPNRRHGRTFMCYKMAKLIREGRRDDIKITFFIKDVIEEIAFLWEGFLIRMVGRRRNGSGPLCNLTWGGDRSTTGYKHAKKARDKIRAASQASWLDPDTRSFMISRMRGCHTDSTNAIKGHDDYRREKIRRLQHGSVYWRASDRAWVVKLGRKYVGLFATYVEGEKHRVKACKASRDGRLDSWLEQLKAVRKIDRGEILAAKAIENKAYKYAKRQAVQVVRLLNAEMQAAMKDKKEGYKRAKSLRRCPWLVDAPYCVFAFLIDQEIKYVGCGQTLGLQKLLYNRFETNTRVKQWVRSFDKLPCIRVILLETKEQAHAWKRAWVKRFNPPLNACS